MPTYEYACTSCEHRFDIVQSFSDDRLTTCPDCEQDALRKVYSAAGIIFKGDGWHIKDYGDKATSSSTTKPAGGGESATSSNGSDGGSSGDGASGSTKSSKTSSDSSSGSGSSDSSPSSAAASD